MSQLRLNPLTGRWVTISSTRAERPGHLVSRQLPVEADPERPCPFCPGNEEATPPSLEEYSKEGSWLVRVVPNKYPAFSGNEPMRVTNLGPVFTQANASGIHEVLVLSPDHETSWADLDDKQTGLVMAAIRDRMEDHGRQAGTRYTQAIVNAGREAGASIEHPHGQLLGIPFVPGSISDELRGFDRFDGSCLLCTVAEAEIDVGHRVVYADDRVALLSPYWAAAPFEMLVVPRNHHEHLTEAPPKDLVAVGKSIRDGLARLRSVVGDFAYNLVFHTAPHNQPGAYHWHVHVTPRLTSVAGFEQGTGVMINIISPEIACEQLISA
ncbi:MAG: galactose-1-phosphate uridylyltransferase [Acidimicrobiales bacterium]|nr:galactose-1-phosphate uridylyltransferase [Acidimicrobiales bacterium]